MLDLFAGLGGASAAFVAAGWSVVRVDNDAALTARRRAEQGTPPHVTDVVADLASWRWTGVPPTFVWASPPCTEFARESMPWCRTGNTPSTALVRAAVDVIVQSRTSWWAVENVRGSLAYLDPLLGRHRRLSSGPLFVWSNVPDLTLPRVVVGKERLSSTRRAERALTPRSISDAVLAAVVAAESARGP